MGQEVREGTEVEVGWVGYRKGRILAFSLKEMGSYHRVL